MIDVRVDAGALASGGDVHGRVLVQTGGSSANAAVWAAHAGGTARVHGRVGSDLAGRLLTEALRERGVDPALTADRDAPTGTMLVVHEAGERSMVADRGANARLVAEDLPAVLEAEAVLISGYLLLQEPTVATALAALERASAPVVAVDAASWPLVEAFGSDRFFEATARATALMANEREAAALCRVRASDAALALGERYRIAAVKQGDRGATLVFDGRIIRRNAEAVAEVDPTGAGDAFDGVLLLGLARGNDPEEALDRACRAGAKVAASAGTWPAR
jgi:sugar/nucleoside kinase (ribokinase family)